MPGTIWQIGETLWGSSDVYQSFEGAQFCKYTEHNIGAAVH
jgi:hypothetical protein